MKVDFAAVDWGTVVARRVQKSPPRQGGWQMFISSYFGVDFADPTNRALRANRNEPSSGWANNPQIESEIAAWYNAMSLDEEKTIVRRLNQLAVDHVVYAPLGVLMRHYAWRATAQRHLILLRYTCPIEPCETDLASHVGWF
jgi:peptide/nickel transport system substrate-binding protein